MQFNMTKAAKLADVSRRTFYNHIDSKKISLVQNDDGEKFVEQSELERIYGQEIILRNLKILQEEEEGGVQERVIARAESPRGMQNTSEHEILLLRQKVESLEHVNASLEESARREREQAQEEKEFLRDSLKRAQEAQNKMTLLLEDQSGKGSDNGDWQKSIRVLEQRIANQEKAAKEREEKEQKLLDENRRIKQAYSKQKKALEEEKSKPVWKRLFG